eukprot:scaffold23184_cov27-Phaeocystis_antarctica.AAC.1
MAELKLIDFGFASFVAPGKESMWDQIGTPSYMAPELWSDRAKEYDSSVDMWALGVVCYMLLSGKRPFHHQAFTCMRCIYLVTTPSPGPQGEGAHDLSRPTALPLARLGPHLGHGQGLLQYNIPLVCKSNPRDLLHPLSMPTRLFTYHPPL